MKLVMQKKKKFPYTDRAELLADVVSLKKKILLLQVLMEKQLRLL